MDDRISILERRARRQRADREFRKAANTYGELTSVEPDIARWWVLRGQMLHRANRRDEATKAFRQATYLFRRESRLGCVESMQRLLQMVSERGMAAA